MIFPLYTLILTILLEFILSILFILSTILKGRTLHVAPESI